MNYKKKLVFGSLIFAFLLQSCTVYQKTPVSISEARATNNKVLVTKTDYTKNKYRKIEEVDGQYFGIIKSNGNLVKVPLTDSEIKTICVLDKKKSNWETAGVIVAASVATILIVSAIISSTVDNSLKHVDILPY